MTVEFEETKKRLSELAQVINEFKSETVQLRVLEWIFEMWSGSIPHQSSKSELLTQKKPRAKKKSALSKKVQDDTESKRSSRSSGSRPGPGRTVDRLISEGFFKSRRTMGAIISYCKEKNALVYDNGDLSPTLGRAIRAGKLEREKNQDNQYEYFQP